MSGACVFLDRDGTIIEDRGYLDDPAGIAFPPGVLGGLRQLQALGLPLVVVTNQSGVGRGYFDLDCVDRIHDRLRQLLEAEGILLDGIYTCPHAPDAGCACRKPEPGLAQRASRALGCVLEESFMIGDKPSDVEMGQRIGAETFWLAGQDEAQRATPPQADHVVRDLPEAARIIGRRVAGRGGKAPGDPPAAASPS